MPTLVCSRRSTILLALALLPALAACHGRDGTAGDAGPAGDPLTRPDASTDAGAFDGSSPGDASLDGTTPADGGVPSDGQVPSDGGVPADGHVVVSAVTQQKYANTSTLAIAVPVEIASPDLQHTVTLPLLLDTGSSGVSVFTVSLNMAGVDLQRVGDPLTITYGGGAQFTEQTATAVVGLGGVRTANPINVRVIDDLSCAPGTNCGYPDGPSDMINQGFHGVIGTGMRYSGDFFSPIPQLPGRFAQGYQLNTKSGQLILGPTAADADGFTPYSLSSETAHPAFPDGTPTWDDRSLPICITLGTTVVNDCAPGLIDSGTWSLFFAGVNWGSLVDSSDTVVAGTPVDLFITGIFDWKSTSDGESILVSTQSLMGGFSRVLGMPFFLANDVWYDVQQGQVGVRPAR
jgi:hypothetical protein